MENLQRTGSFKLRGAMNKLQVLGPEVRERGIVTESSGNHGAAISRALADLGGRGVVFVPENVSPAKLSAIRDHGAEVRLFGTDSGLCELEARRYAGEKGLPYISPYNDPDIIAGQGTVGLEIERQIESAASDAGSDGAARGGPDAVFVALGGGGLIAGIGRQVEMVACSPENSAVMHHSIAAGRVLEMELKPTLSDGTAGGVEPGAITLELCRALVDHRVLVSEEEIATAMRLVIGRHHTLIEGAAGVAVAACLKEKERYRGRRVVIVLCGANIGLDRLREVLAS
jgi:threonine dehydratase